jgi:hypothetical protein
MPENRSGNPRIKYWKKICFWNFFDFVPKSPVFQSSVKKYINQYLILEKGQSSLKQIIALLLTSFEIVKKGRLYAIRIFNRSPLQGFQIWRTCRSTNSTPLPGLKKPYYKMAPLGAACW